MTEDRQKLIDRFQQWLDTNPNERLIAYQCATIAEQYAKEQIAKLNKHDVSNRREQLIAFACKLNGVSVEQYGSYYAKKVDEFLKSN